MPLEHCRSPSWGQSARTEPGESVPSPEQRRLAETPRVCWGRTLPGSPMVPPGPFERRRHHRSSTPPGRAPAPGVVYPDRSGCPLQSRDADWQGATAPGEIESAGHQCSLKHYPGPSDGALAVNALSDTNPRLPLGRAPTDRHLSPSRAPSLDVSEGGPHPHTHPFSGPPFG